MSVFLAATLAIEKAPLISVLKCFPLKILLKLKYPPLRTEAIERGTEMTSTRDGVRGKDKLDVPIKFMWCYASNTLINQNSNISRT